MEGKTCSSTCSNPGCDRPGINRCSGYDAAPYCGPTCQRDDWPHHREECSEHLLKLSKSQEAKASGFYHQKNLSQVIRCCDLSLAKLKLITKNRPLQEIDNALNMKVDAFNYMDQYEAALDSVTERYQLWACGKGPAHPKTIPKTIYCCCGNVRAFQLIETLIHNQKYADAEKCAFNLWEILNTNNHVDNDIPTGELESYLARGAQYYAQAIFRLGESGGIPPAEKEKAGEDSIMLARKAIELNTQVHGATSIKAAFSMQVLAQVLGCFVSPDVDEITGLYEQAISIFSRTEGPLSLNVGVGKCNLGSLYRSRAHQALKVYDLDRQLANLEISLPQFREADRILRATGHIGKADRVRLSIDEVLEDLRTYRAIRDTAYDAATAGGKVPSGRK